MFEIFVEQVIFCSHSRVAVAEAFEVDWHCLIANCPEIYSDLFSNALAKKYWKYSRT